MGPNVILDRQGLYWMGKGTIHQSERTLHNVGYGSVSLCGHVTLKYFHIIKNKRKKNKQK